MWVKISGYKGEAVYPLIGEFSGYSDFTAAEQINIKTYDWDSGTANSGETR